MPHNNNPHDKLFPATWKDSWFPKHMQYKSLQKRHFLICVAVQLSKRVWATLCLGMTGAGGSQLGKASSSPCHPRSSAQPNGTWAITLLLPQISHGVSPFSLHWEAVAAWEPVPMGLYLPTCTERPMGSENWCLRTNSPLMMKGWVTQATY